MRPMRASLFPPERARTLAERALRVCANPDCQLPAPEGVATAIVAPTRAEASPADFGTLDNGIWLCGGCAAQVEANRALWPSGRLRTWARESAALIGTHLAPLPAVGVRPVREAPGVHELSITNRWERGAVRLAVAWQWPGAVDRLEGDQCLARVQADGLGFFSEGEMGPGESRAVRVRLRGGPAALGVAELLEAGARSARLSFGRGVMRFSTAGLEAERSFVVPLEVDTARGELLSIAVDDDVAGWALRGRVG